MIFSQYAAFTANGFPCLRQGFGERSVAIAVQYINAGFRDLTQLIAYQEKLDRIVLMLGKMPVCEFTGGLEFL